MNFYKWLLYRGLSQSSVEKYAGAIDGALSSWAISSGVTAGPLMAITSAAEFAEVDKKIRALEIFSSRNATGHHMYSSALEKFREYLEDGFGSSVDDDVAEIIADLTLTPTERTELVKCRIGQGLFRQRLVKQWKCCSATAYPDASLLVASHIKPWRACTNVERLDHFNGLLLTPNLDKAFDRGLVTFKADGCIAISSMLNEPKVLGIDGDLKISLLPENEKYLQFHRQIVFKGA